jgi:hypothetical protein
MSTPILIVYSAVLVAIVASITILGVDHVIGAPGIVALLGAVVTSLAGLAGFRVGVHVTKNGSSNP